jgi:hypothetical protein
MPVARPMTLKRVTPRSRPDHRRLPLLTLGVADSVRRMTTRLGSAFVPVSDAAAAADWYSDFLDLRTVSVESHAAVLTDGADSTVTLLAPSSGIAAKPGLDWATCTYVVSDIDSHHAESERRGLAPTAIEGDATVCRFFTVRDLDGNMMLIVDQ